MSLREHLRNKVVRRRAGELCIMEVIRKSKVRVLLLSDKKRR